MPCFTLSYMVMSTIDERKYNCIFAEIKSDFYFFHSEKLVKMYASNESTLDLSLPSCYVLP